LIYSAADLAVLPSLADNQPLVALEAMSCGTPVVAFAVGGVPELVRDFESGVCVPERNARQLAAAIVRLLDDRELLRRLSDGARRQVLAHHQLAAYGRGHRDVYTAALQAHTARSSATIRQAGD
jgi:glycosyltransferase involved in cell wall biosynthesis